MTSMTPSDAELLRLTAAGDEDAFITLYRRYQGRVYRFAFLMSGSAAVADDVTQEVFLALMREAQRFDPSRGKLDSYLHGIARHHVLRSLARCRSHASLDSETGEAAGALARQLVAEDDPLGELTRKEAIEAVRRAVLSLPARYREAVVLCDFHGMGQTEAAVALGCPVGTVGSRLSRARAMLAERLRAAGKADSTSLGFDLQGCVI
jgi:RNA polymerase sigma-70 factor (ECF subfamily)